VGKSTIHAEDPCSSRLRLIGDVALTTPLLRAITRRYPGARLTYLVEPAAVPVVRGNPNLSQIVVAPKRRGLARMRDDISIARRCGASTSTSRSTCTAGRGPPGSRGPAARRCASAMRSRGARGCTRTYRRTPDEAPRASVANNGTCSRRSTSVPGSRPRPARDGRGSQAAASVDRRLQDARITGAPMSSCT